MTAAKPRRGRPAVLDRAMVVAAGLELVDEEGLAELSMRRLGSRLGVEAMALYRYVPGKDDLLDAIVGLLVAELDDDPEVLIEPSGGWQDFVRRLAHGVRRVALRHPTAFPLLASRPPEAPWLRPPLRSLTWVERLISGLVSEGFDDEAAVGAYRAFSSFLLGHLLLEASSVGGGAASPLDLIDEAPRESLADYPELRRLRGSLSDDRGGEEFEESLENLLQRVEEMARRSG